MSDDAPIPGLGKSLQGWREGHARFMEEMKMQDENARRSKNMMDGLMDMQRRKNNPAIDIHEDVLDIIESFQRDLDAEHEVGAFVSGSVSPIHIRSLEHRTPSLLVFIGIDGEGRDTVALQHIAQLNLQLVALPKIAETAYRIGFVQHGGE